MMGVDEEKKKYTGAIILFAVFVVLVDVLILKVGGVIGYDPSASKDDGNTITKEDAMAFLNDLISDSTVLDLVSYENDDEVFLNCIRYLYLKGEYVKNDDLYIFNQADINDVAYRFYMKDQFYYIPLVSKLTYNESNQTFSTKLDFDLLGPSSGFIKYRTVDSFKYSNGIASVAYNSKVVYDSGNVLNNTYFFKLYKTNDSLRVKEVSK